METDEFLRACLERCLKPGPDVEGAGTTCMRPRGHEGPHRFLSGRFWMQIGNAAPEQFRPALEAAAFFFGIEGNSSSNK